MKHNNNTFSRIFIVLAILVLAAFSMTACVTEITVVPAISSSDASDATNESFADTSLEAETLTPGFDDINNNEEPDTNPSSEDTFTLNDAATDDTNQQEDDTSPPEDDMSEDTAPLCDSETWEHICEGADLYRQNDCGDYEYLQTCEFGCNSSNCIQPPPCQDPTYDESYLCQDGQSWGVNQCGEERALETCDPALGCQDGACCHLELVYPSEFDVYTPDYNPNTNCTCTDQNPDCYAIYRAKVLWIDESNNRMAVAFTKANNQGGPRNTVNTVLNVIDRVRTSCDEAPNYAVRTSGTWPGGQNELIVEFNIWPSIGDPRPDFGLLAAPNGATKSFNIKTGGSDSPTTLIWRSRETAQVVKVCRPLQ